MSKRWFLAVGLAAGIISLLPAGATRHDDPGKIVQNRIEAVRVGEPQYYKGLTVIPLIAADVGNLEYYTLDEAVDRRAIRIVEKGAGQVGTVVAESLTSRRIFIMDGEEIVGAKQNRVLNSSVMIGPKRTVELPVSCVEQGRWMAASPEFKSKGTQLFARARQYNQAAVTKNYFASPARPAESDQGMIWEKVAVKSAALKVKSPSSAMHEAYVERKSDVDVFAKHLRPVAGQVGALFAINGEIIGADIFDQHRTLEKLLPKLIRSYALDAIERRSPSGKADQADREDARLFLRRALASDVRIRDYASAGEGRDVRLTSDRISGAGLVVSGVAVHAALFAPAGDGGKPVPMHGDRIRPSSERRRNLQSSE